jgi:hypothetical protein
MIILLNGYLIKKILDYKIPNTLHKFQELIIDCFLVGIVPFLIFSFLLVAPNNYYKILGLLLDIITSIILAFIIYYFRKSSVFKKYLGNHHPSSWDYIFDKISRTFWEDNKVFLKVELLSGEIILAQYDKHCFATSFPREQEIYFNTIFDQKGNATGCGIILKGSQIKIITINHDWRLNND